MRLSKVVIVPIVIIVIILLAIVAAGAAIVLLDGPVKSMVTCPDISMTLSTPVPTPVITPTPTPVPKMLDRLTAGCYESVYAISPMPSPGYWADVAYDASGQIDGSGPGIIWGIGGAQRVGSCYLNFPSSVSYPDIIFSSSDENEKYLDYFDSQGIPVIIQIAPCRADVSTVIRLVMDRYSSHPCVKGLGVDVEYNDYPSYQYGRPVTDDEASAWYDQITAYDPDYVLALTHWRAEYMPPTYRKGVYFLYDGLNLRTLDRAESLFANWGKAFPNNSVGYYIGFQEDKAWWDAIDNPLYTLGSYIAENIPNAKGVYWVVYSIEDLYPVS